MIVIKVIGGFILMTLELFGHFFRACRDAWEGRC